MTTPWEILSNFGLPALIVGVLLYMLYLIVVKVLSVVNDNTKATAALTTYLEQHDKEAARNDERQYNLLNDISKGVEKNIVLTQNILERVKGGADS